MSTSYTSQERTALKTLIAAHVNWPRYRTDILNGRHTGEMTVAELETCAAYFGIAAQDISSQLTTATLATLAAPATAPTAAPAPGMISPAAPTAAPTAAPAQSASVRASQSAPAQTPTPAPMITPATPDAPDVSPDDDTASPDVETPNATPADAKALLADVSPFLHPTLMSALGNKLTVGFDELHAANSAPVIVYRGKVMDANPDGSNPAVRSGQERLGALFGLRGKNADFKCTLWNSTMAPTPDPHYQFNIQTMLVIMQCLEDGGDIWLTGHSGTGKTTLVEEIAARTGRQSFRFSMNRQTELSEYIGQRLPDANMKLPFVHGAFVKAWVTQGAIILIDEITMLQAGNAAMFATCLDEGVITIPETGEDIYKADGVSIIACDNTNGTGDESGLYGGTNEASLALRDRFDICILMHYLDVPKEAKLLQAKTGLSASASTALVQFASVQRKGVKAQDMDAPITFRRLTSWAKRIVGGIDSKTAFQVAVLNSASPDDALALTGLAELHAKHSDIDLLAAGQTVNAGSGEQTTPEGKASASEFASA